MERKKREIYLVAAICLGSESKWTGPRALEHQTASRFITYCGYACNNVSRVVNKLKPVCIYTAINRERLSG